MNKRSNISWLIVLAFVALSLTACATADKEAHTPEDIEKQAFNDLRTKVRETIDDSTRQTKIISLVDQLQSDFNLMQKSIVTRKSNFRELFADYDAPREKFNKQVTFDDAQIKSSRKQFGESRLAMLETMTSDEWSALNKAGSKAMSSLLKSMQSL